MVVFWDWEMSLCFLMREEKRAEERREAREPPLLKLSRLFVQIRHSVLRNESPPLNAPLPHLKDNERTREIQPHLLSLSHQKVFNFFSFFCLLQQYIFLPKLSLLHYLNHWQFDFIIHSFIHAASKFQLSNPTKKNIVIFFPWTSLYEIPA